MPYPVSNATTADAYTATCTLDLLPVKQGMTMIVTGGSVYYQQAEVGPGGTRGQNWLQELLVPPGRYNFDSDDMSPGSTGFIGLRVRSGALGVPAQVTMR